MFEEIMLLDEEKSNHGNGFNLNIAIHVLQHMQIFRTFSSGVHPKHYNSTPPSQRKKKRKKKGKQQIFHIYENIEMYALKFAQIYRFPDNSF